MMTTPFAPLDPPSGTAHGRPGVGAPFPPHGGAPTEPPREAESKIWACPEPDCGYRLADGPVPDGEPTTLELIQEHAEEHERIAARPRRCTCVQYDDVTGEPVACYCRLRYHCPTSGEVESPCHGGFDVCCDRPDLHTPGPYAAQAAELRRIADLIDAMPMLDEGDMPSDLRVRVTLPMPWVGHDRDDVTIERVDAIARHLGLPPAAYGGTGATTKYEAEAKRHGVALWVYGAIADPAKRARDAELERLRAEVAELRAGQSAGGAR